MKRNILLIVTLITALYACGVKSAQKTVVTEPSADAAGMTIYKQQCSKCHPAFDVKSKSVDRWNEVLTAMINEKAKLNEADGKLVEAYVWNELGVKGK
ncbi:MAG: hypothetical protein K9J37_07130 [Saprospiraceae bacterium]|nr:hypothetical protein [Saprospiraceae bacterium]MCF8249669.1 hypothetical protein [Saprospiraceae bacterium]MCF8279827.1 hypothetical protein [Bacteroidales bacterium]MCF8312344.1 hypothetical protein [Saprospiraceae bacterium]MCF8440659.1 hypothetical protein [Saprospiraceae bacterium]